MQNIKTLILSQLIVIITFPITLWASPCEEANSLVTQAYYLSYYPAQQKRLLQHALERCPNHAQAHNNLGVLLENENNDTKALYHYRQTLKFCPECFQAWLGLGDVYYKQNQLPLSLEAYLHACTRHSRARQRVAKLLRNNRYRTVEAGTVLNSLLYDKKRLQKLHQMATQCYHQFKSFSLGDTKALLETAVRFRNLHFKTGSDDLRLVSNAQLNDIATALINRQAKTIHIHGHADTQPWTTFTQQKSDELNRQLSRERAESVKYALARHGISITRMKTYGYGSSRPLEPGTSDATLAKNRRVEIEVIE